MLGLSLGLGIGSQVASTGGGGPTSTATLTVGAGATGAGVNKSRFLNATSFQIANNSSQGALSFDRATIAAANTKFLVETTVIFFAAGYTNAFGFDNGTLNFNSSGFQLAAAYPGNAGATPGITFTVVKGQTAMNIYVNGGTTAVGTGTAITDTDVFTVAVDNTTPSAPVVKVFRNGGTAISTTTLTSLIPSTWNAIVAGLNGNGTVGAGNSDSPSVNFGASAFAFPQAGYTYYA